MDQFYLIVVAIAVVLLILCLTGVGILMGYQNANLTFPPSQNTCPDGWTATGSTCTAPTGTTIQGVTPAQGYTQPDKIDFGNAYWANTCDKKKWANMYNINWDGVSNYTKC